MRKIDARPDDTQRVDSATMARRTAAEAREELDNLQREAVENVSAALANLTAAKAQVVTATKEALAGGVSYRRLGEETGRSREFFRSLVVRGGR